jgi:hypothetical protein
MITTINIHKIKYQLNVRILLKKKRKVYPIFFSLQYNYIFTKNKNTWSTIKHDMTPDLIALDNIWLPI